MKSRLFLIIATAFFLWVGTADGTAQIKTDEEILSELAEHPYRAAGCMAPYYAPNVSYTPAPKGYKAFYVSHLGRHGSRFHTHGERIYDPIVSLLDSLHLANCLTAEGDSLRKELRHIQQTTFWKKGMLTNRGAAEHTAIAGRLADRCPSVFCQKDRKIVDCSSTQVQRTLQSMAGFIAGLKSCGRDLDWNIGCNINLIQYKRPEDNFKDKELLLKCFLAEEEAMRPDYAGMGALQTRLFKGYKASDDVLFNLFDASVTAGCLDLKVDPLRFFSLDEIFAFYRDYDVTFNVNYGTFVSTRTDYAKEGKPWLRMIINDADRALDGNGHCADLRFAHDINVSSTMNLLGIGGYAISALEDAPYRYWQSYNQICMASNLQLEFYRDAKGDILVKALFNEREIGFPGLQAVNDVYFRWSDVRRYMICRCEEVREVPDYYVTYLEDKAARIRELQKDEKDGFYFITDMHFPINNGNAAALVESLEKQAGKRLIVYGGDALTYVNDMNEGMAMQISALEQMRGAAPILWARGNHDFVNYTGKKEWITAEREALPSWKSEALLSCFRPVSSVSNEKDPYTAYLYYDNPSARVRYVVFDSTDTVQDDNTQKGLSETQLSWIMGTAVLGAPEGYGIVFISHKPFIKEGGMDAARDAVSAFSTHSSCTIGNETFDFSKRPDLHMICLMSGHRHRDYTYSFPGGQPQINVTADCCYDSTMTAGTTDEQSFDYVSISRDGHIRTVRIGKGEDRTL